MAARLLRLGGRLAVFLPSLPEAALQLQHACLAQVACCEQVSPRFLTSAGSGEAGSDSAASVVDTTSPGMQALRCRGFMSPGDLPAVLHKPLGP